MEALIDSSVLICAFYDHYRHHASSAALLSRYGKRDAGCAAHSLAEVYSSLTGMPGRDRVSRDEALLYLGNLRDRFTLVSLTPEEYLEAIETAAANGISGGTIYDALIAHCALKAGAKIIYTWNIKHFVRLGPSIAPRVETP